MKTDELINGLSRELAPVRGQSLSRWLALTALPVFAFVMIGTHLLRWRPDLGEKFRSPRFLSEEFCLWASALFFLTGLHQLGLPGNRTYRKTGFVAGGFLILITGALGLEGLSGGMRNFSQQLVPQALACSRNVMLLSLFPLITLVAFVRRAAPTRLALTGLVIGSVAALFAAAGLHFSCQIDDAVHILGFHVIIPLALIGGALTAIGQRLLRW